METSKKMTGRAYVAVGLMLFALFFGAGNLIFPAALGQQAGSNVWVAVIGFILTGVGLPLLGVMAMGYSGSRDVQELASRVHPVYGLLYTVLLYLSIGPAFAIPRTGMVSFEIAVRPFLGAHAENPTAQTIFLVLFFAVSLWFSISPQKLVDRIGKVLTPALLFSILVLIVKSLISPMGDYQAPTAAYATTGLAVVQGFLDGYNTMDALASLVFGILVINFIVDAGATTKAEITSSTFKAGLIAVGCLAFVYVFIANIGATSVQLLGILDTGAPVLAESAKFFFGYFGALVLAVIVLLACLTTSIGLITSCATYFSNTFKGISYTWYAVIFAVVSFGVGMYGLKTIISAAIPMLFFLYPLTIVIIVLAFLDSYFDGRRCVYAMTMAFSFVAASFDFVKYAPEAISSTEVAQNYVAFASSHIPFYDLGFGWVLFAVIGFALGLVYKTVVKSAK